MNEKTIAPPFACFERQMGYDGRPIGPDLTIVTVVLQYGVFPTLCVVYDSEGARLIPMIRIEVSG